MKVVIQRCKEATVSIAGEVVGAIDHGMVVLLGIAPDDNDEDISYLCKKISALRIFDDADGVMNLNLNQVDGACLLVSQFTLMADTCKGNRPSYIKAASPDISIPLYEDFKRAIGAVVARPIQCGEFGADMQVALINDGPVTIIIDSKNR